MEKDFYRDGFEQMLKDTTEDFRMYPSRKVWHSLYNDLHPDRKWPSLAVCLVLLTAILHIGVSNNNSISSKSNNLMVASLANNEQANETIVQSAFNGAENSTAAPVVAINKPSAGNTTASRANNTVENIFVADESEAAISYTTIDAFAATAKVISIESSKQVQYTTVPVPATTSSLINPDDNFNTSVATSNDLVNVIKTAEEPSATELTGEVLNKPVLPKLAETNIIATKNSDREWIEDFAFHNQRKRNALKPRLSMQYYITPSIGYRELFKNHDYNPSNGLLQRNTQNSDDISQQAAFNLEAGAALLLDMNKRLRLKAGLQLNYSNYYTHAHELQHPTQTTVLLNNGNNNTLMPVSYSSSYGNVLGSNLNRLSNKVVQVSIPIGADYKLVGTENVKWYVGATIQPSYISSGDAYLISADYKNFASDESMLRKFNLNSSLETFVSFKMPSGTFINIGPQVRYQLLSTYQTQYSYTEKRYNFGFKIGLSKKF